jgi:hypothetical protein
MTDKSDSIPDRGNKLFSSTQISNEIWGTTQPPFRGYRGGSLPGVAATSLGS